MNTDTKQKKPTDKSVKQSKKNTAASTQVHMKIAEIRDDSIVLKNGGLRSILEVSSINFNLKSEDEQNAIIYSYQNFLNSLEFPIQVVIRSKRLDIDNYLDTLAVIGEKQTNDLLQRQTYEYMDYIQRLVEYADIMEKKFYVVIPFDPYRSKKPTLLQRFFQSLNPKDTSLDSNKRRKEFVELKKNLNQRMSIVKAGLQGAGLEVNQIATKDLIEIFYETYNPLSSRIQKLEKLDEIDIKMDNDILDEASREELGSEEATEEKS